MPEVSLTAIAVAFLSTDVSAQRLAISWPRATAALVEQPDGDRDAVWAQLAGVPLVVAQKTGLVLLQHGLLHEDGSIADEVAAVLNALAARKLKELKR